MPSLGFDTRCAFLVTHNQRRWPATPRRLAGRAWTARAAGLAMLLVAGGCAAPHRDAVPKELADQAQLPGFPDVRDWGDRFSPALQRSLVQSIHQARAIHPQGVADESGAVNVLALSGGGANGAFGAGFLCGWSASGHRPPFKLVTGISTGALQAPFAFLGSEYDETLRTAYTTITTKDVYRERSLLDILFNAESLADTRPLAQTIARQVDEKVLAAVAEAHARGRRLFVGTTNIDAGKLVIWDMGAIAASGQPGALDLFRRVMLASAAIPVAFPRCFSTSRPADSAMKRCTWMAARPRRFSFTGLRWMWTQRRRRRARPAPFRYGCT